MFFDERAIETAEMTARAMSDGAIARIRGSLAGEGAADCADCGEPIPAKRRAALPSARRCVGCQAVHEVSGRPGRPTAPLDEGMR